MTGRHVTGAVHGVVFSLLALFFPSLIFADGLAWVAGELRADGSIAATSEMALPFQSTAEALRAFRTLETKDHPAIDPGRQYLQDESLSLTEARARRLIDSYHGGGDTSNAVAQLLERQNPDGGFGERPGLDSAVLDTAFAVEALAIAGLGDTVAVRLAAGYLLGRQSSDGGWAEGSGASSVYLTALSMHALWLERDSVPVTEALNRSETYLLAQRQGATWAEIHETALALLALLPRRTHPQQLADSVTALRDQQLPDGSWDDSVYVTALVLRALAVSDDVNANPDLGVLGGRVVDGDTGLPIAGAVVTLDGTAASELTTATGGVFGFTDLPGGDYLLELSLSGYGALSTAVSLPTGGMVDLGDLSLLKDAQADSGTVRGVVSDARTQEPLSGATISVGDRHTLSGPDGTYQVSNVPAGQVIVSAIHPDYFGVSGSGHLLAGSVLVFSPRLEPGVSPDPVVSTIAGTVFDGATGKPIDGAQVLLAGCGDVVATSGVAGRFTLTTDQACEATLTISMIGYDSAMRRITLIGGSYIQFSLSLYPASTTPDEANTTTIAGVVLDASANHPLGGVEITVDVDGGPLVTVSAKDGHFTIPGIRQPEVALSFTAAGYAGVDTFLIIEPVEHFDIGQVRLRPEGAELLAPDLSVAVVEKTVPFSGAHDYVTAGELAVVVRNRGNQPVSAGIDLKAFHDADANGRFDDAIDLLLGDVFLAGLLEPGGDRVVEIPVGGELPYRDAPVTVAVDTATRVVEASEANNADTTASLCRTERPGNVFDPVLRWHWRGPAGEPARGVYGPPMVGQFSDDNGDGAIDGNDTPDLVFVDSSRALNIVSGADGSEIVRNADLPFSYYGSLSIGDIDSDGRYEIVAVDHNNRSELLALEHDGTLKWRAPTGPAHNGHNQEPRDGVAIADLDADGKPEIVHGARVFSSDGTLLWAGARDGGGYTNYGLLPLAADIDLDGKQEVIAGRTVYDHSGNIVWHAGALASDGFNALGNFDDDEYPEIVLVASGRVHLLEHDGSLTWGPVRIPGGGNGGPPTVADFDGDGHAEIGVAGYSRYLVLDTDGSLLWARRVKDYSSARTGSSVFDFDNDGRAEVLYNDEDDFYVFDGSDGRVLLRIPNGSGTTLEYPIVVNVDDKESPELVLASSNDTYGTKGLRVFESASDAWVPTRSVWNQHSYHIGNIRDDGSIPVNESPSWLSHNTYRLNAFLGRDPLDAADLTLGGLVLVDNGAGDPFSVGVRAGNGGLIAPPGAIDVELYQGDGAPGRLLLASMTVDGLEPGTFKDLRLDGVVLNDLSPLAAVINGVRQVDECDFSNNKVSIPISVVPLGHIEVATDKDLYSEHMPVTLTSVATNTGSFTSDYTTRLRIEDAAGNTVLELPAVSIAALTAGGAWRTDDLWQTHGIYSGDYVLRGMLYALDGTLLDEDAAPLRIAASNPLIDGSIATDRSEYAAWDQVVLTSRVRNTTSGSIQPPALAEITVFGPEDTVVGRFRHDVPELVPGGTMDFADVLGLEDAPAGDHVARLDVKDPVSGAVLDVDEASFVVVRHASQGLSGRVSVETARIYPGDPNSCTAQVNSLFVDVLPNVTVHHLLVGLDAEAVISETDRATDLMPEGEFQQQVPVDTANLVPGGYACLLRATVDGRTVDLDSATFVVLEPSLRLDAALAVGDRGRLLILLDDGIEARDPHGPNEGPPLHGQRAFIEALLERNGISYVIVTTANDFASEMRTGAYSAYVLLSEQEKLAELVTAELQEAVFAGEGLIELGSHDQRHGRIDETLGIICKGKLPEVVGFQPAPARLALREGAVFPLADKGLKTLSDLASVEAVFGDPDISPASDQDIAVTSNAYGWGRSVYGGFDFQLQASAAQDITPYEDLLLEAIRFVQPDGYLRAGRAVPVTLRLTLTDRGIATPGRVVLNLPAGVVAVDVAGGEIAADGAPVWLFDTADGQVLTFTAWLVFPAGGADYRLEADVLTGLDPELTLYATVGLDVSVATPVDSDELGVRLDALASDKAYRQAANFFAKGQTDLATGKLTGAIQFFSRTADVLNAIGTSEAGDLRRDVARLIRQTEMQIH